MTTTGTIVWINFIPFINKIYGKKSFWSIQFYKEIHGKYWVACENFSFVEVSYEYVMVAWLKRTYRANTAVSFIFFGEDTQAPTLDTIYH